MAGLLTAAALADKLATPAPDWRQARACGKWLYTGLQEAGLITSSGSASRTDFENATRQNRTTIASALGDTTLTMDAVPTTNMQSELTELSLVS